MSSSPCGPNFYLEFTTTTIFRKEICLDQKNEKNVNNYVIRLQISVTLKEWDIPFEDIDIDKEHPIGIGRFGTVYR